MGHEIATHDCPVHFKVLFSAVRPVRTLGEHVRLCLGSLQRICSMHFCCLNVSQGRERQRQRLQCEVARHIHLLIMELALDAMRRHQPSAGLQLLLDWTNLEHDFKCFCRRACHSPLSGSCKASFSSYPSWGRCIKYRSTCTMMLAAATPGGLLTCP